MASNERVHPGCVNAANPYHECGVACLEKIAQGHGKKDQKKKSDYGNGIKADQLGIKKDGERRSNPNCPKANNPYHECNENCPNRIPKASPRGNEIQSGSILGNSLSFGRKKNGPGSRPQSPGVVANGSPAKAVYRDNPSPRTPYSAKKQVESDNSHSSYVSHLHSDDSYSQDRSFVKERVRPSEIVPVSGIVMPDDGPHSPPNGSVASYAFGSLAQPKENGKISNSPKPASSPVARVKNFEAIKNVPASPKAVLSPVAKNAEEFNLPIYKSKKLSISGISQATEDSDLEDSISVVSNSYVAVGKYQVRPYLASTLQAVLDKYGDIAANSRLESSSLRSYHLECLCSVVQELQSTPFNQLTRAKLKEMLAVLKDVESANIDVGWLRCILNERADVIDLGSQCQTAEAEKEEYDNTIESMRKELELLGEELAEREKAAAETKARMEDTRTRLQELELEASQLNETISSAKTKLEKYHGKPLAEGIL